MRSDIVREGIETTLSGMQLYGLPGIATGVAINLRRLILPERVRRVLLLVDNDGGTGKSACNEVGLRFEREGREVDLVWPTDDAGVEFKDFNDMLRGVPKE